MPSKGRLGDAMRSQGQGSIRGENDQPRPLPGRQRGLGVEGQERVEDGKGPVPETEPSAAAAMSRNTLHLWTVVSLGQPPAFA